jgi:hypothetical protein
MDTPLGAHKYAFVGDSVYTFVTDEPILSYHSQIGNNDVPYPVAVGVSKVYFMLDAEYVIRSAFGEKDDWEGCYSHFYELGSSAKYPMQDVCYIFDPLCIFMA